MAARSTTTLHSALHDWTPERDISSNHEQRMNTLVRFNRPAQCGQSKVLAQPHFCDKDSRDIVERNSPALAKAFVVFQESILSYHANLT